MKSGYHLPLMGLAVPALAACAGVGAPSIPAHTSFAQPALVIGSVSAAYGDDAPGAPWLVRFERLDDPAQPEYTLAVTTDAGGDRLLFSGMLPPGVYSFRDAGNVRQRYAANGMPMPFEVEPGEVRDLGNYALNPLTSP